MHVYNTLTQIRVGINPKEMCILYVEGKKKKSAFFCPLAEGTIFKIAILIIFLTGSIFTSKYEIKAFLEKKTKHYTEHVLQGHIIAAECSE